LLDLVDQLPPEFLAVSGQDYTAFVASAAAIRTAIALWQGNRGNHQSTELPAFHGMTPVGLIYRALRACHDDFPSPDTPQLPFLETDPELRDSLRLDLAHAKRALTNGQWKASTVLSGSILEALLFWALTQPAYATNALVAEGAAKRAGKVLPIDEWTLGPLLKVAVELNVLFTEDTITEAQLAQNYRNFIHPGKEQRLGKRCDVGTARVTLAAVGHAALDLEVRFP
jgi:hypothetical protein